MKNLFWSIAPIGAFLFVLIACITLGFKQQPNYLDTELRNYTSEHFKNYRFKQASCIVINHVHRCTVHVVPNALITLDCAVTEPNGYTCTVHSFVRADAQKY